MSRSTRGLILVLCALAALVVGAGAAGRAQAAAPAAADWTAVSGNTATGSLQAASVSLAGTHVWNTPISRVDGSWPYFAGPAFSPALAKSDVIQISGGPGYSYTLGFLSGQVTDPILELGSLGSKITFPSDQVTRLSGERDFTVSPDRHSVSGTASNAIGSSGNSDSSGTIKVTGTFDKNRSLTFTATPNYTGPEDGILVQLVGQGVTGGTTPTTDCSAAKADYNTTVDKLTQAAAEKAVFCLANEQRQAQGVAPLKENAALAAEARRHAEDSVRIGWWGSGDPHKNPERGDIPTRIRASGYCTGNLTSAENAFDAAGVPQPYPPTPKGAVDWWMQSKGHHDNLMNPALRDTGVGVVAASPRKGETRTPAGTFVQTFGACA